MAGPVRMLQPTTYEEQEANRAQKIEPIEKASRMNSRFLFTSLRNRGEMSHTTTKPTALRTYLALVRSFPLRSIQTEDELDAATEFLNGVLQKKSDEGTEAYRKALTDLIEVYENRAHQIPDASEIDVLRMLMESNGLSQVQLASKTGVAQSTISAVLNGTRILTRDHIISLARFFKVSPAVFLPSVHVHQS
jgi:HTH-type transcriptional regulator / antitoxin HigA